MCPKHRNIDLTGTISPPPTPFIMQLDIMLLLKRVLLVRGWRTGMMGHKQEHKQYHSLPEIVGHTAKDMLEISS